MSNFFFQFFGIASDVIVFIFAGYFLVRYISKEKQLDEKEKQLEEKGGKIDTEYHKIVDNALTKERKILEDATAEADTIITHAEFATKDTQEKVNKALEEIIADVHKETANVARTIVSDYQHSIETVVKHALGDLEEVTKKMKEADSNLQEALAASQKDVVHNSQTVKSSYEASMKQVAGQSLLNFQAITHELELSLQNQIKDFHDSLLPNLEREIEEYKQERMKEVDKKIDSIIQKVSQKALNKTLSTDDHKNLIVEALEKAKKEGIFD